MFDQIEFSDWWISYFNKSLINQNSFVIHLITCYMSNENIYDTQLEQIAYSHNIIA